MTEETNKREVEILTEAFKNAFGADDPSTRFVDLRRVPLICVSIVQMAKDIAELKDMMDKKYVTKDQFSPVKTIVYGMVGLVLVAVVGALLALILR